MKKYKHIQKNREIHSVRKGKKLKLKLKFYLLHNYLYQPNFQ